MKNKRKRMNLLDNAIRFSPRGQSVAIGLEQTASEIRCSITDHGPILIEGNRRPGWDMVQMLDDMGEKDKLKAIESAFIAWKARESAAQK